MVIQLWHPDSLVQRFHTSSFCYMHAPATAFAYNIRLTLGEGDSKPTMINLADIIRNHFTAKQLETHVFADEGGSSLKFLRTLLAAGSLVESTGTERYQEWLQLHGPALVANFEVYPDFLNQRVHKHYGSPPTGSSPRGQHAMVLVGARVDESGRRLFLLQNWWKEKQFVEVDEEYLKRCGAVVHFITTPQSSVPSNFAADAGHWFETEMLDKPECYSCEDM